jgi:hypothetical protein
MFTDMLKNATIERSTFRKPNHKKGDRNFGFASRNLDRVQTYLLSRHWQQGMT